MTKTDYIKNLIKEGKFLPTMSIFPERIDFSPNELKLEKTPRFSIFKRLQGK